MGLEARVLVFKEIEQWISPVSPVFHNVESVRLTFHAKQPPQIRKRFKRISGEVFGDLGTV